MAEREYLILGLLENGHSDAVYPGRYTRKGAQRVAALLVKNATIPKALVVKAVFEVNPAKASLSEAEPD